MKEFDERAYVDIREVTSTWTLINLIKVRLRLCEKYGIDYESYIDKDDLQRVVEVLDCCLDHKDSKYILRK